MTTKIAYNKDGSPSYEIILKAEIVGYSHGKRLPEPYRMVMVQSGNQWVLCPEQSFNGKFNEHSRLPGWSLSWLLKNAAMSGRWPGPQTELYIDYGQEWSIKGVNDAITEAIEYI